MIADMSSDILSRPIDVSKYAMIYGGAQKNLSMAGVTFVIVKEDALGKVSRQIPTMLDYRTHVKKGSMFNTPPVVPIYSALMNLRYIKAHGGVKAMEKLAKQRAEIVYGEIWYSRGVKPFTHEPHIRTQARVSGSSGRLPRIRYL